jgi:hypothetical protein
MEKRDEIKVIALTDTNTAKTDKLVLTALILVGLLSVLLIVTRGTSGF